MLNVGDQIKTYGAIIWRDSVRGSAFGACKPVILCDDWDQANLRWEDPVFGFKRGIACNVTITGKTVVMQLLSIFYAHYGMRSTFLLPPILFDQFQDEMKRITREPDFRTKLASLGMSVAEDTPESFAAFEKAAAKVSGCMECHVVTGEIDYFMLIRTRDSESFNRLHAEQLLYLPGVRQVRSFMVLRNVLSTTELPLAL